MPIVWVDLGDYEGKGVEFDQQMFDGYQRCLAVRIKLSVLRTAAHHTVLTDDAKGIVLFKRYAGDQRAYVVLNRSGRDQRVTFETGPSLESGKLIDAFSQKLDVCFDIGNTGDHDRRDLHVHVQLQ